MGRIIIGILIVLHGLAHASVGVWASASGPLWIVTILWFMAIIGYLVAGFGVLRAPGARVIWKPVLAVATVASIVLLLMQADALSVAGMAVDAGLFVVALAFAQRRIDYAVTVVENAGVRGLAHPLLHRVGWGVALAFTAYAGAVVLMRPVYLTWGTTAEERRAPLPGDELAPGARYRVDHAITIRAPAPVVWRWLAQMGQDRGGFYSHDWLERLFADDVHNADRIHPEWQRREVGELLPAVQENYLGGIFGPRLGWRVLEFTPGRSLVLENWGAFVLVPLDSSTTRLFVRTRGEGAPSLTGVLLGAASVFVFEPAHFIMQGEMLRGIRARAEREYHAVAN